MFFKITNDLNLDKNKKIHLWTTSLLDDFNKDTHENVGEWSFDQNVSTSQPGSRKDSTIHTDINKRSTIKRFKKEVEKQLSNDLEMELKEEEGYIPVNISVPEVKKVEEEKQIFNEPEPPLKTSVTEIPKFDPNLEEKLGNISHFNYLNLSIIFINYYFD